MPWRGVTVSEQRHRFLEDYQLSYYSVSELAERFSISRKTAHKSIHRFEQYRQSGIHEHSPRPHSCLCQTDGAIVEGLVATRKARAHWGPRKLPDLTPRRHPQWQLRGFRRRAESSREKTWLGGSGVIDGRTRGVPRAHLKGAGPNAVQSDIQPLPARERGG